MTNLLTIYKRDNYLKNQYCKAQYLDGSEKRLPYNITIVTINSLNINTCNKKLVDLLKIQ